MRTPGLLQAPAVENRKHVQTKISCSKYYFPTYLLLVRDLRPVPNRMQRYSEALPIWNRRSLRIFRKYTQLLAIKSIAAYAFYRSQFELIKFAKINSKITCRDLAIVNSDFSMHGRLILFLLTLLLPVFNYLNLIQFESMVQMYDYIFVWALYVIINCQFIRFHLCPIDLIL